MLKKWRSYKKKVCCSIEWLQTLAWSTDQTTSLSGRTSWPIDFDRPTHWQYLVITRFDARKTVTSEAGSQYRCGQMGRITQPPASPHPQLPYHTLTHTNTQCANCSIENARFLHFQLERDNSSMIDGPTDQRTGKASYRVAFPQLKRIFQVSSVHKTRGPKRVKMTTIYDERRDYNLSHISRERLI